MKKILALIILVSLQTTMPQTTGDICVLCTMEDIKNDIAAYKNKIKSLNEKDREYKKGFEDAKAADKEQKANFYKLKMESNTKQIKAYKQKIKKLDVDLEKLETKE